MDLKTYLSSLERGGASKLAEQVGVSASFLSQMAAGSSAISPARCVLIERATGAVVSRRDLRPGDWQDIWPELLDHEAASPASGTAER
ncbi:YdaS family helix-turn-helix protein [Burkholderia glumae]